MDNISQALASAVQFHQAGNLAEAQRLYREVLAREPMHPTALHLLGAAAFEQGRPAEAIDLFSRAVEAAPNNAVCVTHLGTAYAALQQWDRAAESLRRAVALDPRSADAHYNLGIVQHNQGQLEGAIASFERAVDIDPARVEAHYNLGNTWTDLGRLDAAEQCYREAILRRPGFFMALNNLGNLLRSRGRLEEAVARLRQAVDVQPDYALGHHNLGTALADLGRFDQAATCFSRALAIDPRLSHAHDHLGTMLQAAGRFDEALAYHERALQLDPQLADAHFNRATLWLRRGDFEAGWPEYEWRWKCKNFSPYSGAQPRWDGGPLAGRTILIQAEQGLGDTLQFLRYASLVHQRGGHVLLQCQPSLMPLLERCPGVDALVSLDGPLPEFDVYAPLMSLPGILGTTHDTIPNQVPYLVADPHLIEHWRQKLADVKGFRVGIAWQGNPQYRYDRLRSVPLTAFQPLADVPGVRLFSLQKGWGAEQIAAAEFVPLVNLDPELDRDTGAFTDTAAVIQNLDLVISSDNAVPHVAGGLGVPVWVALPVASDWRWLCARDDSPWYPTMRLFRQKAAGDWDAVFRRMAGELTPLAAGAPRFKP